MPRRARTAAQTVAAHRPDQDAAAPRRPSVAPPPPRPWSRRYAACQDCGETSSRHRGRGLCLRCYMYQRDQGRPRTGNVGRSPRIITPADLDALCAAVDRSPHGERWTLVRMRAWLAAERGVTISWNYLAQLLRKRGRPQRLTVAGPNDGSRARAGTGEGDGDG